MDRSALRFKRSASFPFPAEQGQLDNAVCVGTHEGHAFKLTASETEILVEHEHGLELLAEALGIAERMIERTHAGYR